MNATKEIRMYVAPKFLLARHPQLNERTKPTILSGDTFQVVYEARKLPQGAPNMQQQGAPADVSAAYVRLRSDSTTDFIEIGGVGVSILPMQVEPSTMNVGAILTVTVPGEFLVQSGNYVLYVTALFDDDNEQVTETRRFRVNSFN